MKRNFEFDVMTIVKWDGKLIDLHNCYDLETFGTDFGGTVFEMAFRQNAFAIPPHELPEMVTLSCSGNLRIVFNDLCAIAAPIVDEGIEIAYFNDECGWRSFLTEELAREWGVQGLHVSFVNGLTVRIFCDEVVLTTM